ncbi:unnamed protein product [Cylicocyclus nassatus]|uniref:Uncharacterized protein n=1 Tax=Cylicocyclus nassatus TaxID=53992 RepID=A0AA36DV50_CYLNA|nr:unnamed protein product [Cylicocyclus nassatus]
MPEPIAAEPQLFTPLCELGQLLASYGYVPRATFRPANRSYPSGANGYPMHANGAIPHASGINGTVPSTSQYGGMERRPYRDQNSRGGRGSGTGGGPRRGNGERNYHQGGRRNGGANGSYQDGRRRSDYCNGGTGTGTNNNNNGPALSVSTGNLASAAAMAGRDSFRRERNADGEHLSTNDTSNTSSGKGRRWEADSENGSDGQLRGR